MIRLKSGAAAPLIDVAPLVLSDANGLDANGLDANRGDGMA